MKVTGIRRKWKLAENGGGGSTQRSLLPTCPLRDQLCGLGYPALPMIRHSLVPQVSRQRPSGPHQSRRSPCHITPNSAIRTHQFHPPCSADLAVLLRATRTRHPISTPVTGSGGKEFPASHADSCAPLLTLILHFPPPDDTGFPLAHQAPLPSKVQDSKTADKH